VGKESQYFWNLVAATYRAVLFIGFILSVTELCSSSVGLEVLTAVSTNMAVFWVVAPCIALMMEAARTSETLINFYQTTRRYNPEDSHLCSSLVVQRSVKLN
jgi:hypothetical protein